MRKFDSSCKRLFARILLACSVFLLANTRVSAQDEIAEGMVKLDGRQDMELRALVEFVAQRLGEKFIYDPDVLKKKVNIVAPDPIPVDSLLSVLQSVLKNEGMLIAEADAKGWKKILPIARLPEVAQPMANNADMKIVGPAVPLTRVFTLKNVAPSKISELVRPTMSTTGASLVPVDNQSILIVTDVAANILRIEKLLELLDTSKPLVEVKFVPARNVQAQKLLEQLAALLVARSKALGRKAEEGTGIEVSVEDRSNQIILIGNSSEISEAERLLNQLDKPLPTTSLSIRLEHSSPEQLDMMLRRIIDGRNPRPPYEARKEGQLLIVDSTSEVLDIARRLQLEVDTPTASKEQSPVRFYRIRNVPAQELHLTIQSIFTGELGRGRRTLPERSRTSADQFVPGANLPPIYGGPTANPFVPLPQTPAARTDDPIAESATGLERNLVSSESISTSSTNFSSELIGNAQVTVDIHTNTIIVVAKPEVQRIYAQLIEQLDERRPQVLVEAKVVIVDTSDNFTLGVEVSGGDRTGANRSFAFTSYGFSTVDPVSGALQLVPGVGFNGALVDPSTADFVVRALSTHRRARVLSSPKILVNDNAEGELTSVLEIPFTSVNASQTVATTSFAGFAEAGTTINVTPTISEDNYLQLDYTVTLNTFTGDGLDGVPPPRQTNEVRSRVTVPDGYTVIVGGLTTKNDVMNYRGLPWLEKIPVIRELTGTNSNSWNETSLFVFLRPVVLRDDKFKDLKYLSDKEICDASIPGEYPGSASLSIP